MQPSQAFHIFYSNCILHCLSFLICFWNSLLSVSVFLGKRERESKERNRKEKLKCFRSWGRTTLQIQLYSRNKHFTLQMKLHSGSDHWMATIYVCKELIFFQFALVLLWAFLVARRIYLGRIWRPVLFVDSCLESLLVLKINSPWC